uniref:Ubiquitinyl hydrolase 1 n=1 Tax=Chlamydomonas leiostraca TaxID=1034604 RepID=A0A7S0R5S7_9CHLO|mmetsp:Transcript_1432/g.3877  ORF Transcript_1432/g.3877 Transcript_1432/m.3877 type:complete len:506 (+) Transcript_1432:32-1549(+)|eukprot:CAMPEP_0202880902 /NCGR_PEP_ID=MMETSP1391-20130828/35715_1 /ASSEMBLY_ACC=CAM_ASM_000867 /TAXON_ID=1034604 /ORGANISM="Chlamydomonas leiostraca, Strain SAG 11-49" /LENGTH=505 /DNA_ID=CAMNT_0049563477 /DNA_START=67 /DNA_END=1584 /DNA_ORIENTATION=-
MVKRERSGDIDEEEQKQLDSASKRQRQDAVQIKEEDVKAPIDLGTSDFDDDDEGDGRIHLPKSTSRAALKKGIECPYLDTVSRQNLDFDFEKCCSVTLSHVNVYVCLVCGKYFQGRSLSTQAYTHSLETGHHMFMKLDNGKVYCLPDNYEVVDRSLDDVRYVLNPRFTPADVARLDKDVTWARALDGTEYMPGLVGLNNMKRNDYANVIIQVLARIAPIRDFFLIPDNYKSVNSVLVLRFGELLRKIWNSRNFKGQVSPHEFMQAVILASKKRFTLDSGSDPVDFFSWLLNALHADLTGGKVKKPSIITQCFQGELEVVTEAGTGKGKAAGASEDVVERTPFLLLGLDLPAAPLFKDSLEKNIIPQVPIFNIMRKFDGEYVTDDIRAGRRRFRVTRLPQFMCLHMKRFTKNNFFVEKNPTIVNFPVKNMELKDIIPLPEDARSTKYDLVANLVHDGKANEGTYRAHVHRKVEEIWYEVQDLRVIDILPQMVALSEAYFQVYELKG